MTHEEMEQKFEFIIKQQESFADSQAEVFKMLHELAERQDKTQLQLDKTQEQVGKTSEAVLGLVAIVGNLAQSQKVSNEHATELSERLDIFINMLERYISDNRNGSHGKES